MNHNKVVSLGFGEIIFKFIKIKLDVNNNSLYSVHFDICSIKNSEILVNEYF